MLRVPFEELGTMDYYLLQEMMSVADKDAGLSGSVCTGTGLGSDAIVLQWGKRRVMVRGRDLLALWVASFDKKNGTALLKQMGTVRK